jgi:putative hydrolase
MARKRAYRVDHAVRDMVSEKSTAVRLAVMAEERDPVEDLRRIAFLLERANEATYRVPGVSRGAAALGTLSREEIAAKAADGTLTKVSGVGDVTARCVVESLRGEEPVYLRRLTATEGSDVAEAAAAIRKALRGDCHSHSDWSDGGSSIEEMVGAAIGLGHSYLVLTDHSPRLTVARGLSPERLREQLDVVAALNATLTETGTDFVLLTGIEVDILADGSLDQEDDLLAALDVVVGSVHSGLRDESDSMTRRMLRAIANPHLDILGHCTGRRLAPGGEGGAERGDRAHRRSRGRPESEFDAEPSSRRAKRTVRPSRSTVDPTGWIRQSVCCGRRTKRVACSRSTRTRTHPGSWTGCTTDVSAPRSAESTQSASSIPGRRLGCSNGPRATPPQA